MDVGRPLADWRSPAPYVALGRCDRSAFAWEWLRRSDEYRRACLGGGNVGAARFGLHRFVPADHGVPEARPMWRWVADPTVLCTAARRAGSGVDAFDFAGLIGSGVCVYNDYGEHWLWSDGVRGVRLDIVAGTLHDGPVVLDLAIGGGVVEVEPQALALQRLVALARTGRIVRKLFAAERRAARWALILRVHDALAAGASQRDIASELLGLDCLDRWRIEAPSVRARVQRLVSLAQSAAAADPLVWLR